MNLQMYHIGDIIFRCNDIDENNGQTSQTKNVVSMQCFFFETIPVLTNLYWKSNTSNPGGACLPVVWLLFLQL